jgi:hypothetical protein
VNWVMRLEQPDKKQAKKIMKSNLKLTKSWIMKLKGKKSIKNKKKTWINLLNFLLSYEIKIKKYILNNKIKNKIIQVNNDRWEESHLY